MKLVINAKWVNIYNLPKEQYATLPPVDNIKVSEDDEVKDEGYIKDSWNENPNLRDISLNETIALITIELCRKKRFYDLVHEKEDGGTIGVIQLIRKWSEEFEDKWSHHEFGVDEGPEWYDAVDEFLDEKIKAYKLYHK